MNEDLAAKLKLVNPSALSDALKEKLAAVLPRPSHVTETPIDAVSFRVIDIEATGLSTTDDDIIEIAIYEHKAGKTTLLLDTLIRPERPLPPRITELTGITEADLAAAPPLPEVWDRLRAALDGDCLVAHNTSSDMGYLHQMAWRFDPHWLQPPALCTLKLSRELLPDAESHALKDLAEALHLALPTHRARPDAFATVGLLAHLLDLAKKDTLGDVLAAQQRKPKERPQTKISPVAVDALPDGPGVYRFYEVDRLLYVGYSVDVRRRVREHLYRVLTPASLEIARRADRIEVEATATELDAFVREGQALQEDKPVLNARNAEHGRIRYFRVTKLGGCTLAAEPNDDEDSVFLGPIVLHRAERNVLRAVRDTFGLSSRGDKKRSDAHRGRAAFIDFIRGEAAPKEGEHAEILTELRRSLHRAEAERLDALRPFRTPVAVSAQGGGALYLLSAGRPTRRIDPVAGAAATVRDWLAQTAAADAALDTTGQRISAYVRAHPKRVLLEPADALLFRLQALA